MTFSNHDSVARGIDAVASDRRSGALELADKALAVLARARPAAKRNDAVTRSLLGLARRLGELRPAMPAVANAVAGAVATFRGGVTGDMDSRALRAAWAKAVAEERRHLAGVRGDVAAAFCRANRGIRRPITISASSAVLEAFVAQAGRKRLERVTVCESRPLFEGRRMARRIRDRCGVAVDFITEAQCAQALPRADAVVIGCDAVFSNGSVANKVGSYPLAVVARRVRRRVIVLADVYKFARRLEFDAESRPAREVWAKAPRGVSPRNVTFEIIPDDLIDSIVFADGAIRPSDVRPRWRRARRRLW